MRISSFVVPAAIVATALVVGAISLLIRVRTPEIVVEPAGRDNDPAAARCDSGARLGASGVVDSLVTIDRLPVSVRTPRDYDPTRAYPLLVVYPPAGLGRYASEQFYGLTREATRQGFIVAYSDHVHLSRAAVRVQARAIEAVTSRWCIDASNIVLVGHSDGGTVAQGIALLGPGTRMPVRGFVASAAGVRGSELAAAGCPAPVDALIVHERTDDRSPGYGREAATFWAGCAGCSAEPEVHDDGCSEYRACQVGKRIRYCEIRERHGGRPAVTDAVLRFAKPHDLLPSPAAGENPIRERGP